MSVPSLTITDQGIQVPTTADVVNGLWSLFTAAFGSDLNTDAATPQAQLITSLAALIQDERNQFVQLLNQVDPNYSTGIWQDGIGYIYFLTRQAATHSTAQVTFTGLSGVIIPQGFLVQDANGYSWATTSALTIGISGTVTGGVQCTTSGAIAAASDTITIISVALTGLDRITNPAAAVVGIVEESRANFETRRANSVAANAKNTDASVRGTVANLSGVVDVWVKSNNSDSKTTFGATNYAVSAHSILVSVVGGVDYDIAWQILTKAGSGVSYNGNTTINVTDTDTYPSYPPQYAVKFLRPTYIPIYFQLQLEDKTKMSYQDQLAIQNAIIDAMAGGSTKARIAQTLRAVQYLPIIASAISLNIYALKVSTNGSTWVDVINLGVDQFPTVSAANITVI